MDRLWSPWRYGYVIESRSGGCFLCDKAASEKDQDNFVVHRGVHNFVLLNSFPYGTGHMMIVPYAHVARLGDSDEAALREMMLLARDAERHLGSIYKAEAFNAGLNIGAAAGAGVADHLHMHVLPRWPGDVNFMTAIGETRVLPEDLTTTWTKLKAAFAG